MITLERFAYSPVGAFGRLRVPGRFECFTVERPWADNRPHDSCIPEGQYVLRQRVSPVVQRTSGGEFASGWEVTGVPGRSLIMIHPGNTMADVQGCIAVGDSLGWVSERWGVLRSRHTFRQLMAALDGLDVWHLTILSIAAGKLPAAPLRAFP